VAVKAPNRCLDVGRLAAYLDGRLSAPGRRAVEAHVAVCERCYDLLTEASKTADRVFPSTRSRPADAPQGPGRRRSR
jgi:anti-sigma factor RsiW